MDGIGILWVIVLIVAGALYWIGSERMKTITELRKKIEELTSREGQAQRSMTLAERDARHAAQEAEAHLRPYVKLFTLQQPPSWYHPYFSASGDWNTEYEEKSFRSDKDWSHQARELLSHINTLSADNRRILEEAARLQAPTATDTPLLLRTREVLAIKPSGVQENLFQIEQRDLVQLERWIDFVLGVGVREYQRMAAHTRDVAETIGAEEEEVDEC